MKWLVVGALGIAAIWFLTRKKPEKPQPKPIGLDAYFYKPIITYPPTLEQRQEAAAKGLRFVTRDSGATYGVIPLY